MTSPTCPSCGSDDLAVFHEEAGIPAHSCLLLADEEEARTFPRGTLRLGLCRQCGFITNTSFEQSLNEYSARYEETQGFSPRFRGFARALAKRWVDEYDLHGKRVLEIGCGKGEFLVMMCEAGVGSGIGIDPSVIPERVESEVGSKITWITDLYSETYADLEADAIVCRHTLEHIAPVGDFMRMLRHAIGDRTETVVLFELPDVLRVLQEVAFWDVYYEHCSYFSAGSLARLFRASGFEVLDVSYDYDDQYLLIEARPSTTPAAGAPLPIEDDMGLLEDAVQGFRETYDSVIERWRSDLRALRQQGRRAVIWGAGSKGVSYLNNVDAGDDIKYAVDINPYKQGMYMAGTGHRIVAPDDLREYRPDLVIAMNPVYLDEIRRELDARGVQAELTAL